MRIYFSGIGGVAIGPLAEIALDAGYEAIGSDPVDGLMTEQLRRRGVAISSRQDGVFLRAEHTSSPIDWFVYTAALPDDHPELVAARELGIKTAKRDELIAHIIAEKNLKLIAVAGTHGKTTTTGMLVWCFKQLGIPVSYSVGTTIQFGSSGEFDPASEYFVYECDEFDRNFLHFTPYLSLITSVDYDHPDTYPTEADYITAFRQFIHQSQSTILWQRDADFLDARGSALWCLQDSDVLPLALAGEHNRRNGTLVVKALERLELDVNASSTVEDFPGTDRRFEKLADNLYSDYGHHPVEIKATLQLARELSEHVVLVYQPHQNIRQHEIKNLYTPEVFTGADTLYWLPTYLSREDPNLEILTPATLTAQLEGDLQLAEMNNDLWQAIEQHRAAGHLVLGMGAGSIDGWLRQNLT